MRACRPQDASSFAQKVDVEHPLGVDMTKLDALLRPAGSSYQTPGDDAERRGERVDATVVAAQEYLVSIQAADGHWRAELEGDSILESEYVMLMHFLGRSDEPKVRKAAEYLRQTQLETGGWTNYFHGPVEVSASVKAYFVLKLMGDDPDAPHMVRARTAIHEAGGIDACNSFTKTYLAIFGQVPWSRCPAIPPEMVLLPRWAPFHIYRMSSWSRTLFVPLSIMWAHRPRVDIPAHASIEELWAPRGRRPAMLDHRHATDPRSPDGGRHWRAFFRGVDRCFKTFETLKVLPFRKRALQEAERWILERLERSDGLGAIFPPIVNTIIALRCLGYPSNHPIVQDQVRELEKLQIEEAQTLRVQPCASPVWDTGLTMEALVRSGLPSDHPALLDGARWLLHREVRRAGDWSVRRPGVEPGGWCFEYENEFYPDLDDTAQVLKMLGQVRLPDEDEDRRREEAMERGFRWMRGLQNQDGGWGAFDADCNDHWLVHIPFADHNAMIDPSCEDVTARALEALALRGMKTSGAAMRAAAFLRARQEPDGSWYGRWGCNYLYGTWLAVTGLVQASEDPSSERIQRALRWLRTKQNPDGGWGELPRSYDDPSMKAIGPSTAAQTAWALLAFLAAGDVESASVRRGLDYLIGTQRPDGSWWDEPFTGTGFPRVFYLRYHLYATYFPLLALGVFRERASHARGGVALVREGGS
jgi:squalene-hopene/tetraprenyl-beta-curcumene cyclase